MLYTITGNIPMGVLYILSITHHVKKNMYVFICAYDMNKFASTHIFTYI